jgi:hypothetical protein
MLTLYPTNVVCLRNTLHTHIRENNNNRVTEMLTRNLYNCNYGNMSYALQEIMCCYCHDLIKYNVTV